MDPGAGPRRRHSMEGKLFFMARSEAETPESRREDRIKTTESTGTRARMGAYEC